MIAGRLIQNDPPTTSLQGSKSIGSMCLLHPAVQSLPGRGLYRCRGLGPRRSGKLTLGRAADTQVSYLGNNCTTNPKVYGMMWYGVVWYGMVLWYGVLWLVCIPVLKHPITGIIFGTCVLDLFGNNECIPCTAMDYFVICS